MRFLQGYSAPALYFYSFGRVGKPAALRNFKAKHFYSVVLLAGAGVAAAAAGIVAVVAVL